MSSSKQSSITSIKDLNGNQSWDALLKDLYSASLGIPEDWPQETSAQWSSDGLCLVVTVPAGTDKEWLERKILPVARIYFRENNSQRNLVIRRKGKGGNNDFLVQIHKNAYEEIVEPRKMVPVPFYMFNHWLPVFGPSLFWVVLAMRQQSFVNTSSDESVCKLISTRELAYWAPLSYSQISRLLNREGYSSWFYRKEKEGYEDVPPEYKVWSQVPLAPHHLYWLDNHFRERPHGATAAPMVENLLDNTGIIRGIKKEDLLVPEEFSKKRHTLSDIIADHFPEELDEGLVALAIQLEYQITRENMFLSIPHYFFKMYGDVLSSNESAFIWYLRSVYKEADNDSLSFKGYSKIKNSLGCSLNTAKKLVSEVINEEISSQTLPGNTFFDPELPLNNWLSAEVLSPAKKGFASEISIRIRAIEPIHPNAADQYNSLLRDQVEISIEEDNSNDQGVNNATGNKGDSSGGVKIATGNKSDSPEGVKNATGIKEDSSQGIKNATGDVESATPPVNNATDVVNNATPNLSNAQHLKSSYKDSLNTPLNDSLIPPLPSSADQGAQNGHKVVGVGEINLEKLLGFGSYKHDKKKELAKLINKNQEIFLAWIIRNHKTAAKFPVRLAVTNVKEGNETEDHYLEIAKLGWGMVAEIVRVNENDMDMWKLGIFDDAEGREYLADIFKRLSKLAIKVIKELKDTDFLQLVENVLVE